MARRLAGDRPMQQVDCVSGSTAPKVADVAVTQLFASNYDAQTCRLTYIKYYYVCVLLIRGSMTAAQQRSQQQQVHPRFTSNHQRISDRLAHVNAFHSFTVVACYPFTASPPNQPLHSNARSAGITAARAP
jgi:hypothetical protein